MLYQPPTGGAADDHYVGKTPSTVGSKVPPKGIEQPMREIVNAIKASNQTPSDTDLTQLAQAISRGGIWLGTIGGTANALTATLPGAIGLPARQAGMRYSGIIGTTNTGAATLTLSGFTTAPGARNVTRANGQAVQAGDLAAGSIVEFADDGTNLQVASTLVSQLAGGGIQTFFVSGTFTVPAGVTRLKRVRGGGSGGGGGGGANSGAGAGGAGGGYSESTGVAVTPGQTIATTIGTGGSPGNGSPTAGSNGGTTSAGSIFSIPGGTGGASGNGGVGAATTPASAPTGGQFNRQGGVGGGGASAGSTYFGGVGGGCPFTNGPSPGFAVNGGGSSANTPSGGGGGGAYSGTGGSNGAVGADGYVIYEW